MQYPNRIADLFNQGRFDRGGPRLPIEGDIGPRPIIGPRYLEGGGGLTDMFGRDPRDRQRLMSTGRPRDRQGLALGDRGRPAPKVTGGKDDRPGAKAQYFITNPRTGEKIDVNAGWGGGGDDGDDRPPGYWEPEGGPGKWISIYYDGKWMWVFQRDDGNRYIPGKDRDLSFLGPPEESVQDDNPDDWNPGTGGYADAFGGRHLPSWMTPGETPGQGPPFPWLSDVGGEDTRALPRGFGMDWFDDLLRHFNWEGDWNTPERRKETGGKLSMKMSANMLNIMNRIANQGVLGPEGRKFITSGDKRESQLRRKGLRKEMERGIGKKLGPRGGGAIENMLFNQLDAPDFARREEKASGLREFDMKSRMAGVEGLSQMLNFFEAMFKGEQTRATGGPGALSTIGDVGKIAASIAALL